MEKATISGNQQNARHSGQTISSIIAEYKKGQRTVKEFCSDKGIKTGTFYCWLSKQRKSNKLPNSSPAFVSVKIKEEQPQGNVFAEYKGLRFYQPMSVEFFKALIG
jgi:transposase-like protein